MIRNLIVCLISFSVLFTLGCESAKKKEEKTTKSDDIGPVSAGPEMQFYAQGSDSGKIPGLSTIHFDLDQASLTTSARKALAENADWIKGKGKMTVQIEGHCDSRGSVEYNLALGERRAKAVKNYLVSLGIEPNRLTIISYGKEKPFADGDDEMAWQKNRRANFVPLPN